MTSALPTRVGAAGCIDGLVTVPTPDGPALYACLAPCCKERREAARAERAAQLGDRDPFVRLPQIDDEAF